MFVMVRRLIFLIRSLLQIREIQGFSYEKGGKTGRRKTKKQKQECLNDSGVFTPRLESRKTEKH